MDNFLILKSNFFRESSKERLKIWIGDFLQMMDLDFYIDLGTFFELSALPVAAGSKLQKKNQLFCFQYFSVDFWWCIETLYWMQNMYFVLKSIDTFSRFGALKEMSPSRNGRSGRLVQRWPGLRGQIFFPIILLRFTILFSKWRNVLFSVIILYKKSQ